MPSSKTAMQMRHTWVKFETRYASELAAERGYRWLAEQLGDAGDADAARLADPDWVEQWISHSEFETNDLYRDAVMQVAGGENSVLLFAWENEDRIDMGLDSAYLICTCKDGAATQIEPA